MKNPYPRTTVAVFVTTACLALVSAALAVDPPPDGGYPGNNTAEGEDALFSLGTGVGNTGLGFDALFATTTGSRNTAAGSSALLHNTTGGENTAVGVQALQANFSGIRNTAIGVGALFNNTKGNYNTAVGYQALNKYKGPGNTAVGVQALANNVDGGLNTAVGDHAMANAIGGANTAVGSAALEQTIGNNNVAIGDGALADNTTGYANVAVGSDAMAINTTGIENTASGFAALLNNISGNGNTALGNRALEYSNTSSNNTAVGDYAGGNNTTGDNNTAIGQNTLFSNIFGDNNIALGASAGTNINRNDNIDIGNAGVSNESGTIRIGTAGTQTATYIAGIRGAVITGGVSVMIDLDGRLGTLTSSARYKEAIKPIGNASEDILSLKPVTFHYGKDLDPQAIPQFGLVAEQVEKVNPDLVARDEHGKPYTVRYEAVNAMLLNEFIKEHRKTEEQGSEICDLKATVWELKSQLSAVTAALKEQAAELQKVSDQVIKQSSVPRVVANN